MVTSHYLSQKLAKNNQLSNFGVRAIEKGVVLPLSVIQLG